MKISPSRRLAAAVAVGAAVLGLAGAASPASPGAAAALPAPVSLCAAPAPGDATCAGEAIPDTRATAATRATGERAAAVGSPPAGTVSPSDLQSAYGLAAAVAAHAGAGRTVGIVDAYGAPTLEADLAVYRAAYGLPPCTSADGCLRTVNQAGDNSPLPAPDPGWAAETSMDVEAVSAVCPDCRILLVEADGASAVSLAAAEDTAVRLGASAVSNSWGAPETSVIEDDVTNTGSMPKGYESFVRPGVPILAATGDGGFQLDAPYPADLTSVIAVGGTTLEHADTRRGWTETVWGDDAGHGAAAAGCSAHIDKPAWQHDTGCPGRTVADVSADADPTTGLAVYDSTPDPAGGLPGGWFHGGGTSLSTPLVTAMYVMAGHTADVDGPSGLYSHRSGLTDVVGGSDINVPETGQGCAPTSYLCTAVPGYDAPTGLGSPYGLSALTG